ncbi:MAG: glycosyltransferase [Pseudomonadota bacterium]
MKSPNHSTPSGDREIARLTLKALDLAGFAPALASELRIIDLAGDREVQIALMANANDAAAALIDQLRDDPPDLWFTYHCHYKAPDLIGPVVARDLSIPYAISEPSISPKRRDGPWAQFAAASDAAIAQADALFWTTERDRPALSNAGHSSKMTHLPAFTEPGPDPAVRPKSSPVLQLLTVAMMRPGDKVESYLRLAAALQHLSISFHLTIIGDGPAASEVKALFSPFAENVTFAGRIDDRTQLRAIMDQADLFLWPGVGEGVGMVFLEAQAAGLPVIAEDHAAAREVVHHPCAPPPNDPNAYAKAITYLADAERRAAASASARQHVLERHSLAAAARILRNTLEPLLR